MSPKNRKCRKTPRAARSKRVNLPRDWTQVPHSCTSRADLWAQLTESPRCTFFVRLDPSDIRWRCSTRLGQDAPDCARDRAVVALLARCLEYGEAAEAAVTQAGPAALPERLSLLGGVDLGQAHLRRRSAAPAAGGTGMPLSNSMRASRANSGRACATAKISCRRCARPPPK